MSGKSWIKVEKIPLTFSKEDSMPEDDSSIGLKKKVYDWIS